MVKFDIFHKSVYKDYGLRRMLNVDSVRSASHSYDYLASLLVRDNGFDAENMLEKFVSETFPFRVVRKAVNGSPLIVNVVYGFNLNQGITDFAFIKKPVTSDGYQWFAGLEFIISERKLFVGLQWEEEKLPVWEFSEIGKVAILFPQHDGTPLPLDKSDERLDKSDERFPYIMGPEDWRKMLDVEELPQDPDANLYGIDRPVSFYSKGHKNTSNHFVMSLCQKLNETFITRD